MSGVGELEVLRVISRDLYTLLARALCNVRDDVVFIGSQAAIVLNEEWFTNKIGKQKKPLEGRRLFDFYFLKPEIHLDIWFCGHIETLKREISYVSLWTGNEF